MRPAIDLDPDVGAADQVDDLVAMLIDRQQAQPHLAPRFQHERMLVARIETDDLLRGEQQALRQPLPELYRRTRFRSGFFQVVRDPFAKVKPAVEAVLPVDQLEVVVRGGDPAVLMLEDEPALLVEFPGGLVRTVDAGNPPAGVQHQDVVEAALRALSPAKPETPSGEIVPIQFKSRLLPSRGDSAEEQEQQHWQQRPSDRPGIKHEMKLLQCGKT